MSDEKCLICDHYICNHGRYGCHVDGCKCVRTCYVADHPNYAERAAEIERLRARVAELEAERDRWKAIAEKRHAILLNLEWSSYDHDDEDYGSYCPCCTSMDDEVHVAGCKMAEAIAESARTANGENTNE